MIDTAGKTTFDCGDIRITPNVQDRVNEMKRRQAEESADRHRRIAMEAMRAETVAQVEAQRLRQANTSLLVQLHAVLGWPNRLLLPAPGARVQ